MDQNANLPVWVIIDLEEYSPYAKERDCLTKVRAKADALVSGGGRVMLLGASEDDCDSLPSKKSLEALFKMLGYLSFKPAIFFYLYADEPHIDMNLARAMLANHMQYRAGYSFAEGYPQGLAPMIIGSGLFNKLAELAGPNAKKSRSFIFETIRKDVNFFDIETEISPVDLRSLRVAYRYDTKNNAQMTDALINLGAVDASSSIELIPKHVDKLWALPAYYNLQIASDCPQKPSYRPEAGLPEFGLGLFMDATAFIRLLDDIVAFSGEAVIGLGYLGEPALHPQFPLFIKEIAARPSLSLNVETSGLGWSREAKDAFLAFDGKKTLIIGLDAMEEPLYRELRGEGFAEAVAFAKEMVLADKKSTWLQCMRTERTEPYLEKFYRSASELTDQVIIQKYDNFLGFLPQEPAPNIAPVKREVCWALKRELSVRLDGSVAICREDLKGERPLGNIFALGVRAVWEAGEGGRLSHAQGLYEGPCASCDEYYVFNF